MRKLQLTAGALVAFALVSALLVKPAGALDGHAVAIKPGVTGSGTASLVVPINESQQLTQYSCRAVATGIAPNNQPYTSTSVDSCVLTVLDTGETFSADPANFPGDVATTVPEVVATPLHAVLKVCWQVSARPLFGPTSFHSGCTTVNTSVLAA